MHKIVILAALAVFATPALAEEGFKPRPMEEMHGDCSNYRWDVSAELALWAQPAVPVSAATAEAAAPEVAAGTHLAVTLAQHADVTFPIAPATDRGGPDKFSGLLRVTIATPGTYRISASTGLWIDLVGPDGIIASSGFEMQTKCPTVFKVVAYDIKAPGTFLIQLNGAKAATADLAVTRVP